MHLKTSKKRRLLGNKAFALSALASKLANATNSFSLLASTLLRRLFIVVAHLHFAENTFALHLLLESAESLVDIVIADKYLHENHVPLVWLMPAATAAPGGKNITFARPQPCDWEAG